MRQINKIILLVLLQIAALGRGAAQDGLLARGDKNYASFSYTKAIECYELAFKKDVKSIEHARRLADSYWNLRDNKGAERWYAVVASSSQATSEDVYRYAELLRVSGQYADSDQWMKRYAKLAPNDSRIERKENAMGRLADLLEGKGLTHKLTLSPISSESADMAPFIHGDTVLFASSRVNQYTSREVSSWNEQPFLNLYQGRLTEEGTIADIAPMGRGVNTRYHESNAVISHDGNELYFTRNNFVDGHKVLSEEGVNNLQIFVRHRTPEGWSKDMPFPYNSNSYSVGHPAISKDGQRLFFTSNKPGGKGGKDIYVCYRDENRAWGEPQNLGDDINTEGDEMFPYVFENVLYFASDGHLGLGGLDLFRTTIRGRGFGLVDNLNAPINSSSDDFGICLDAKGNLGFVTSDRDGALGSENIFTFRMNSKPDEDRVWTGRVMDIRDARPVPYLPIRLLDKDRNELARTVTSANGVYEFSAPTVPAFIVAKIPGGAMAELEAQEIEISLFGDTELPDIYLNAVMDLPVNAIIRDGISDEWLEGVSVTVKDARDGTILFHGVTSEMGITQGQIPDRRFGDDMNIEVTFMKEGYFTKKILVDFRVLMFLDQALTGPDGEGLTPVNSNVDMAKAMNLQPILFDFREHVIRSDAAGQLDLVAQVLKTDPTIRIELRSHTDSRASTEYNDALSQRRAESTRQYLILEGVAADRITAKGFGERRLVNQCADGVECSEAEHQENRRTEFVITDCKNCGRFMTSAPR